RPGTSGVGRPLAVDLRAGDPPRRNIEQREERRPVILTLVPPAFDHLGRDGVPAVDHPYELELWRKARHRRLEELPQLTRRYRIVPGDPRRPRGESGQQCGGI